MPYVNPKRQEVNKRMSEFELDMFEIIDKHQLTPIEISNVFLKILLHINQKKLPKSYLNKLP